MKTTDRKIHFGRPGFILCSLVILSLLIACFSMDAAAVSPIPAATDPEWDVIKLVNRERIADGLEPLSVIQKLQQAADIRAEEITTVFSHTRPDKSEWKTIYTQVDLKGSDAAENIGAGSKTADDAMGLWMDSSGHRSNIMKKETAHIGVGYISSPGSSHGQYWVQLFLGANTEDFSGLSLFGGNEPVTVQKGRQLSELNLALEYSSGAYGTCYMPLIDEMCGGFDSSKTGMQRVTIKYRELSLELDVYVTSYTTNSPFDDVRNGDWYFDQVIFVHNSNLFAGTSDTTFSPGTTMTRAMMVQVLYNLEDSPASSSPGFSDVPSSQWYYKAVGWAAENKIVTGVGSNSFAPTKAITREEMAVILHKYSIYKDSSLTYQRDSKIFSDQSKISSWASNAVNTMYRAEILSGYNDGSFRPDGNATRAEVASMFKSFVDKTDG